jgi:serine/threonine protein kinase
VVSEGRRYKVLGILGVGGFGTVYRAELRGEGGFRKQVALKVLNPDMSNHDEVARRFRDEARMLGLVRHGAIVRVDGLVWLKDRWAVVMEYIDGMDMRSILETEILPPGPALAVVSEVAEALHITYHQRDAEGTQLKLLHRDIKPSNIQITASGEVKILDFGTARAEFAEREAKTRSLYFGTMDYMAPERMDCIDGPEGDVYALGTVLYEALVGERLGKTSPNAKRHHAHLTERMNHFWQQTHGESEELYRLVVDLLSFEPTSRPTAKEVDRRCADLQRSLNSQRLRDWATQKLPSLMEARAPIEGDELTGSTLFERADAPSLSDADGNSDVFARIPSDAVAGRKRRSATEMMTNLWTSRRRTVMAGVGTLFLIGINGVEVVRWVKAEYQEWEQVETEAVEVSPVEAAGSVVPEAREAPAPDPDREASSRKKKGKFKVSGDATRVVLVGKKGTFKPRESMPPGTYTIMATFPGRAAMGAGKVQIRAGKTTKIKCRKDFTRCSTD